MQAQQKFFTKLYLPLLCFKNKVPHLLLAAVSLKTAPSVALLLSSSSLFSFQGAIERYTLKIEQCKTEPFGSFLEKV